MKTNILLVVLLSAQLVYADQFKVHYSIHGSGRDIIVDADSSGEARYTVPAKFQTQLLHGLSASESE